MKNIHVLPTDKPSRLVIDTIENKLYLQPILHEKTINVLPQHIYITSDEDINKDTKICWCIDTSNNELVLHQGVLPNYHYKHYKKIIMTTDKSIDVLCGCGKDCGAKESEVQPIDDEFLEWFVKNPSCEWVEIKLQHQYHTSKEYYIDAGYVDCTKEQYNSIKSEIPTCPLRILYKIIIPQEEPKQETLEEAAERLWLDSTSQLTSKNSFIAGAKWMQERMYSEEELKHAFFSGCQSERQIKPRIKCWEEWFEQFKKNSYKQ